MVCSPRHPLRLRNMLRAHAAQCMEQAAAGELAPGADGPGGGAAARAQVQCITHFLQLPIEDDLLADLAPAAPSGQPLAGDGAAAASAGDAPIPFADAGNPVMAQARSTSAWTGGACAKPAARIGDHPLEVTCLVT